jgi:threonyl-tRNA synthetase
MIYKNALRSYRELPLRWAELGTVYRYERSGVLHGLLRVRGFTQDDAHIICTPEQMGDEIRRTLRFSLYMWKSFGFEDISFYVATKPSKSVGAPEDWEAATEALQHAITAENLEYTVDEGGGAFYGPKIDFKIRDAIGREWQVSTIQFDFNLPERFDMTYVDYEGKNKRPYVVHRALLGSLERFLGLLIEHYNGAFPVWLAPQQLAVIPVKSEHNEYAEKINERLLELEYRSRADLSNNNMNVKIRNGQKGKVPYMLIVGDKEKENNMVSLRTRTGEQKNLIPFDEFLTFLKEKNDTKELI